MKGGLLANYFAGSTFDPDQLPEEKIAWTMEPLLDLTAENADFAGMNKGDLFTVHMQGAIYVEDAGIYRLITTASDSIRIKLHGQNVIQAWQMGDLVTQEVTFELKKGWHPIDIVYVRDIFRAHLQFWLAKEGELPEFGDHTNLGFLSTPIPSGGLNASTEIIETGSWGAVIRLNSNAPVILNSSVQAVDFSLDLEHYRTEHVWSVLLPADGNYQVKINIWDIWGRAVAVPTLNIQTDAVPDYVEGGLLGRYYNQTNFTEEAGIRFDPRIYLPEDVGDGRQDQSFGMHMNNNNFSVRWEGAVRADTLGEYTFFVGTDDGRRFWLDGQLLVEYWVSTALTYDEAKVTLGPGWHPIKFEMYEGGGLADAKLEWRRPDGVHEIIPSTNLGTVLPEEDESTVPVISDFESGAHDAENDDNDALWYQWKTNVLSTCTLSLQGLDASQTIKFDAPANGFKFRYMMPPYGNISATIYVTSMYGVPGQPETVVLSSPTPYVPPEEE
jgi:hypothetical protein